MGNALSSYYYNNYAKQQLLKQADQEKIDLAVSQQVALVGSKSLYEKINKNFKEKRFDAIFAKVKFQNSNFLFYAWRGIIFRMFEPVSDSILPVLWGLR